MAGQGGFVAEPNEDDPDIVFNPNEPRGDLGMTMEEAEDYITKLEAENKRLEAENLRVISNSAYVDANLIREQKVQIACLTEQREYEKSSAESWRQKAGHFEFLNDTKKTVIGAGAAMLGLVLFFAFIIIKGWTDDFNVKQMQVNQLTKELEVARHGGQARAGTAQTEVIATKTEEPTPQTIIDPLISIYVSQATLLGAEPAGDRWPLIIQLNDGRKMRVFVNPLAHYRAMCVTKFGHTPERNFTIMDYCLIDPTWHDPDGDLIEEPLFKFSLDDYGPKRKPKRAEY